MEGRPADPALKINQPTAATKLLSVHFFSSSEDFIHRLR
jgi:hypothetical protein